ncbi:MAG: hypothetical protein HQL96_10105 [Magnetococcales bacterium]|nr:hypothetical protein [Magnetococcales bacterium]
MKKIVAMLAVCLGVACPWPVHAADLTVPHTFAAGTPIRSSEINENFLQAYNAINDIKGAAGLRIILKNNNEMIGSLVGLGTVFSSIGVSFVTKKGYIIGIELDYMTGKYAFNKGGTFYYATSDCTGNAFLYGKGVPGMLVNSPDGHQVYYLPINGLPERTSFLSVDYGSGCMKTNTSQYLFRSLPNDPEVTGFPNALTDVSFAIE